MKPIVLSTATALLLAGCGSSSGSSTGARHPGGTSGQKTLKLTISDAGRSATISGPATTPGGVVQVTLQNRSRQPRTVQLVRVEAGHTTAEAYKQVSGNSPTTPSWLRAAGGVSTTLPGQSNTNTVRLVVGKYLVSEVGGPGSSGPPAKAELTVTSGMLGSLPGTSATVTAAAAGKDRYHWQISGLHAGHNQLTFRSQGAQAIHFLGVIRIKPGQNPSLSAIQKQFRSNGPPQFADLSSYASTAILDGGQSQVTTLDLRPGTYVLFCPLTDRDGGKPHTAEGLLTKYTVK